MSLTEQSYYGDGILWMKKSGSAEGFRDTGEVDELNLAHETDKKVLPTRRVLGGGNRNSFTRVNAVELAVKFRDFSPENLAIGVFGSHTAVVSGSVIDEQHTAYHDALVKLVYSGGTNIDVQDQAGGAGTTYTLGTDYELSSGGIRILSTGTITDGQTIYVDYDNPGTDVIEALTNSGYEYELYFDGLNEAQSGEPFTAEFFRAKASIAESLGLLNDDYGELSLTFEILQDESKTGAGLSKYYKLTKQAAA